MTELVDSLSIPEQNPNERHWESEAYRYCVDHYQHTAQTVMDKIIESNYAYGYDSIHDPSIHIYGLRGAQSAWKVHEYIYSRASDENNLATIYLIENGQLVVEWNDGRRNNTDIYKPGKFYDTPNVFITAYCNMIGLVEDDNFREQHLRFLEDGYGR
jgi:hypothetical protein